MDDDNDSGIPLLCYAMIDTSSGDERLLVVTEPISSDIEVAEFAGQLFFRLWRASHTRVAEALESVGLTPALFALLNVLGARQGAIQQQLSGEMGIDPSAMVALIDELEGAGLAERRRRPGDRRAWEIAITPKGRRALDYPPGRAAGKGGMPRALTA